MADEASENELFQNKTNQIEARLMTEGVYEWFERHPERKKWTNTCES